MLNASLEFPINSNNCFQTLTISACASIFTEISSFLSLISLSFLNASFISPSTDKCDFCSRSNFINRSVMSTSSILKFFDLFKASLSLVCSEINVSIFMLSSFM